MDEKKMFETDKKMREAQAKYEKSQKLTDKPCVYPDPETGGHITKAKHTYDKTGVCILCGDDKPDQSAEAEFVAIWIYDYWIGDKSSYSYNLKESKESLRKNAIKYITERLVRFAASQSPTVSLNQSAEAVKYVEFIYINLFSNKHNNGGLNKATTRKHFEMRRQLFIEKLIQILATQTVRMGQDGNKNT